MNSVLLLPMSGVRDMLLREYLAAFVAPLGRRSSTGVAVVMADEAVCWLDGGGEAMHRKAVECGFKVHEWPSGGLATVVGLVGRSVMDLPHGSSTEVGLDGMECSAAVCEQIIAGLRRSGGITVRTNVSPWHLLRKTIAGVATAATDAKTGTASVATAPVDVKTTGISVATRLNSIRRALRELHADGMLMADSDDIAWALNLGWRNGDKAVNREYSTLAPLGYMIISTTDATLYINNVSLSTDTSDYLRQNGIVLSTLGNVKQGLNDYFEQTILMDPDEVCYTLLHATPRQLIREASPVRGLRTSS